MLVLDVYSEELHCMGLTLLGMWIIQDAGVLYAVEGRRKTRHRRERLRSKLSMEELVRRRRMLKL
jgi:hypothetical protein